MANNTSWVERFGNWDADLMSEIAQEWFETDRLQILRVYLPEEVVREKVMELSEEHGYEIPEQAFELLIEQVRESGDPSFDFNRGAYRQWQPVLDDAHDEWHRVEAGDGGAEMLDSLQSVYEISDLNEVTEAQYKGFVQTDAQTAISDSATYLAEEFVVDGQVEWTIDNFEAVLERHQEQVAEQ